VDYVVRSRDGVLDVDIPDPGNRRAALIETLEQCSDGTCECPTDEILGAQVSVDVEDSIDLHMTLTPRNGEALDIVEVDRAVRWTIGQLEV
jgi:hypothetical protein